MAVLIVPQIGSGIGLADPVRPYFGGVDLSRRHGWGQASSVAAPPGSVAVWTSATPHELDTLASVDGVKVLGSHTNAERRERERMIRSLETEIAPLPGARWTVRDEFVSSYREQVEPVERAERRKRVAAQVAVFIAQFGIALALSHFGPECVALGLTVFASDYMSGTSANMNGRAMDQGGGGAADVWTVDSGTWSVAGGVATSGSAGENLLHDGTASAVDVQRTTVKFPFIVVNGGQGALARFQSTTKYYLSHRNSAIPSVHQLYKVNSGSTQLGSNGSNIVNNDTVGCDASGSAISGLVNGTVDIGPITDTALTTGVGGIRGYDATNTFDEYVYETASSSQIKTFDGVAIASVKTIDGVAIAGVKKWNGVANA